MTLKILIFGFIFLFFELSCKESIIKPEYSTLKISSLKASKLSTNHYVAKTGNDNNAGTYQAPFLTLQKGYEAAIPGDTVIVGDGVYTTSGTRFLDIWSGGTSENYITLKSEHKWGAVLDGQNITTYPMMFHGKSSYINILDFEMKNFQGGIWSNDTGQPSSYVTLQGNKLHDFGRNTVDGGGSLFIGKGNHHWTITKNTFFNIGRIGPDTYFMNKDHAIYISGDANTPDEVPHDMIIAYNLIWNCSGAAIQTGSSYTLIANNTIAWSNENSQGGTNFIATQGIGGSYLTIVNNIFYQPPVSNPYALRSYTGYTGWSVKNNIVYGGSMWISMDANTIRAMTGNNYGQIDCEKAEVDPRFVSANRTNSLNVDFRLQPGSPAINAGVSVGLTTDNIGNPIIGLPDIGARESTISNATIGLNTIGSNKEISDNGYLITSSFTAVSNIIINRMNLYVSTALGNARLGLYSDNSGQPGNLLAQTGEIVLSNGWNSGMLGASQNLTSGTTYWLAIEVNSPETTLHYNSVSGRLRYKPITFGSLPLSVSSGLTSGEGLYSVYADNNGGDGSITVTGTSINPLSANIPLNYAQQLTAVVSPSDATNKTVSWSSDNTSVATVNGSGLVTGVAVGSAAITGTTQDGGKTATCTVNVIGDASIIGLNTVGAIKEKGDLGYWIASSFTALSSFTATKMNIYVSTASGNARLGIYSSSSGQPGTLLTQTAEIPLSNGWNRGALGSSQYIIAGITYWLVVELNSSATTLFYNSATGRLRYKSATYGSLPSTIPLNCDEGAGVYSIYAN